MKNIERYLKSWWSQPLSKYLLIGLLAMALLSILISSVDSKPTNEDSLSEKTVQTADTFIPAGFVLVPIDLVNYEPVSGLIGDFALVDLFTAKGSLQKGGEKIGSRLKMIRAPLNPQQFAVLVPEDETHKILQAEGPFFATVLNPNSNQKSRVMTHKQKRKFVEYFN